MDFSGFINFVLNAIMLIAILLIAPHVKEWYRERKNGTDHDLLLANISSKYSRDAKIISNTEGKILYFNRAAEDMFGRTKGEMLNNSILPLIPEKYRARHIMGMEKFRKDGVSSVIGSVLNMEGLHKQGNEFPIEMSIYCDVDHEGNKLIVAVIKDLSIRKEIEQKAKADVILLEEYEEIADIGGWDWDLKSDVVSVTKNFRAIFELNGGVPTSEYLMKRVYKEDEERVSLIIKEAFENPIEKDYVVNYRIKKKNDEIINIECVAKAIYENGEHTRYRGTVRVI
jgi:PAS domain S-box-containing protein